VFANFAEVRERCKRHPGGQDYPFTEDMKNRTDIDRLHNEIQELVDELWHLPRFAGGRRGFRPQADCIRSEEPAELRVIVELPGVDPTTIKVVAADRVLVVAGERRRPKVSGRYRQLEIEYGPFQRRIPLDEPVDASAASARYEQGMLIVSLPIAAKAPQSERVAIVIRGRQ
jgi:HSP20 family molecular chaperone IbpA